MKKTISPKQVTNPNLFMKIVLVALMSNDIGNPIGDVSIHDVMVDYSWEVYETSEGSHDYHVIGCHPVARRLDFYLKRTFV
jgi:hypothetical protein